MEKGEGREGGEGTSLCLHDRDVLLLSKMGASRETAREQGGWGEKEKEKKKKKGGGKTPYLRLILDSRGVYRRR